MPRISTSTIVQAYQKNALLPILLRECRSIDSAQNEFRWLRDRALQATQRKPRKANFRSKYPYFGWRTLLKKMCWMRSTGMPLQYILGDQPFGNLDILCKKGVLIPRHETEAVTLYTAELVLNSIKREPSTLREETEKPLRILDFCTGTGCIPLLLHSLLSPHFQHLSIVGIDISRSAIRLARENVEYNVRRGLLSRRALSDVSFQRGDVLGSNHNQIPGLKDLLNDTFTFGLQCDILISNPPYISPDDYRDATTSRSVRLFEPVLALVPPSLPPSDTSSNLDQRADLFYRRIVTLLSRLQAKLVVLECGSRSQALRVVDICNSATRPSAEGCELKITIWPVTRAEGGPYAVVIRGEKGMY